MPKITDAREKLLKTATMLFSLHGVNGVSTAQIAEEAGVNKTLIFYHFKSKEGLYFTIFRERIEEMRGRMHGLIAEIDPGFEFIESFVKAQIEYLNRHHDFLRILVRELVNNERKPMDSLSPVITELSEALKPIRKHLLQSFAAEQEKGTMREVDPVHTLVNIISLNLFFFLGLPLLQVVNPETASPGFNNSRVEHVLDFLLNGLKTHGE